MITECEDLFCGGYSFGEGLPYSSEGSATGGLAKGLIKPSRFGVGFYVVLSWGLTKKINLLG